MRVTQRDRQRVRRVGAQPPLYPQQCLDHVLHLRLLRRAGAGHGQLHLARRVLVDASTAPPGRAQRGAPGLAQLEGAVGVRVHEHPLDRDFPWRIALDQFRHVLEDQLQPVRKPAPAGADAAAGEVGRPRRADVDDAEAGHHRTRIEAQDADLTGQPGPRRHCAGLQPQAPRPPAARRPHQGVVPCTRSSALRVFPDCEPQPGKRLKARMIPANNGPRHAARDEDHEP